MSLFDFFTGNDDILLKMEALIREAEYREALSVGCELNEFFLSSFEYRKFEYLGAICWFNLGELANAESALTRLFNYSDDEDGLEYKAKELLEEIKIAKVRDISDIKFPDDPFTPFFTKVYYSDVEERRMKEGTSADDYVTKVQVFDNDISLCLTFYWKKHAINYGELFVYLGDDIDQICKYLIENDIDRIILSKSREMVCRLLKNGKNGPNSSPSLYLANDYTKPPKLAPGNTYVLGMTLNKDLPTDLNQLMYDLDLLGKYNLKIMEECSQDISDSDKLKICSAYLLKGITTKIGSNSILPIIKDILRK